MAKVQSHNIMIKTNLRTKAYTIVLTIIVFVLYGLRSLKISAREFGTFF